METAAYRENKDDDALSGHIQNLTGSDESIAENLHRELSGLLVICCGDGVVGIHAEKVDMGNKTTDLDVTEG